MAPQLNADIKERICQIAHAQDAQHIAEPSHPGPRHFSTLCAVLTHVDSEWRLAGMRHAWQTLYIDDLLASSSIIAIRLAHGAYTRKLWIQVRFQSIASHYRRYALTHENTDIQPFCDLALWPRLTDLEIVYAHKCAFPGLTSYLEPRLGRIRRLTVSGRVPIDMRRGALLLRSAFLEEIHFFALPREDDSLSSIASHSDPILSRPFANSVRELTLTALIDIRIVCAVLGRARQQLRRLELIGMSSEQLATAGLLRLTGSAQPTHSRVWTQLAVLAIGLLVYTNEGSPVCVNLDASEFPQLRTLAITDCPRSSAFAPDSPTRISYEQTFAKDWERLTRLRLPALSNGDAWAVAKRTPRLATLHVQSGLSLCEDSVMSATGLWHLLTAAIPLNTVCVSCPHAQSSCADRSEAVLDFGSIGKNHPARIIDTPLISLTERQVLAIRRACCQLFRLEFRGRTSRDSCVVQFRQTERLHSPLFIAAPYRGLANLVNFWRVE
ncbi:hypothetical protein IWW55_003290 [Coemansia sp. RSA 2706]|nr:hypothetical protein IWW55_003290 [Coemansia sp. RSA 2706]